MLSIKNVVLIVIDVQEKLVPHIYNYHQMLDATNRLIRGAKVLDIPLLLTEQYPQGLGETVPSIREPIPEVSPIIKNSFSCCGEKEFIRRLDLTGKSQALICGIEAHVCVYQTCLDLKARGYEVHLVADCISSRKDADKQIAIRKLSGKGIELTTMEMALFEMLRDSSHVSFKEISGIVK